MAREAKEYRPESPWAVILLGLIVCALGGLLLASTPDVSAAIGWAVLIVGGTLTTVGAVGAGVTMGMLRFDHHLRHRD